jgi:hypothetical protein
VYVENVPVLGLRDGLRYVRVAVQSSCGLRALLVPGDRSACAQFAGIDRDRYARVCEPPEKLDLVVIKC